ncbi:MAG: ribbon-helix-helix domain-containing protein [Eubacterium sp.]|nr:ribbon-helix-helix domain-containing protein [Eubacterium sp.]
MNTFKPKKSSLPNESITLRINPDLLEKVDSIACSSDISRNKLIIQCIEFALENMEK